MQPHVYVRTLPENQTPPVEIVTADSAKDTEDNIETATGYSPQQLVDYIEKELKKTKRYFTGLRYEKHIVNDKEACDYLSFKMHSHKKHGKCSHQCQDLFVAFWIASDGELHTDFERIIK